MKIVDGLFVVYFILGLATVESDLVYVSLTLLFTTLCYFAARIKKYTDEVEKEKE